MKVERGTVIHRGDLLFVLDNTHEQAGRDQAVAALVQAKASLAQQQSNLVYARTELNRQNNLARDHAGTPTQLDQALTNYQQSEAQNLPASGANRTDGGIRSLQPPITLSQRAVVAQTDGPVQDIYFREGEYVPASTPVLSILPPANVYVRFFVPESQLSHVHLGQKVRISCDGCGAPVDASISFIAQQEGVHPAGDLQHRQPRKTGIQTGKRALRAG